MEQDTKGDAITSNAPQDTDTEIVFKSDYLKYKADLKKIIQVAVTLSYKKQCRVMVIFCVAMR